MKKIQDIEVKNKKIILRADFNVAIEKGSVRERFKIMACRDSVRYLTEQNAKVALVSHLGRPDGVKNLEFSLGQIKKDIENILGVKIVFLDDCIGEKVEQALEDLKGGEVLLLENARFHAEEEGNEKSFAEKLAAPFDVFINDAFSVCHRDQASVTGVAGILPRAAGFWLQKEIANLDKIKDNPERPAAAIIGGAKIETKLPLIKKFEKSYDWILVGSKIATEVKEQKMIFGEKVIMPLDYAGDGLDIGPATIAKFKEIIFSAKTIVWNGPLGKFEKPPYDFGTKEILSAIVSSPAFSLIGGGESVEVLEANDAFDKISFVSTGGGATLEYLIGNKLPGLEALE